MAHNDLPDITTSKITVGLLTINNGSGTSYLPASFIERQTRIPSPRAQGLDITAFIIGGLRSCFSNPFCDEPLNHTSEATTYYALTHQLDIAWFELLCRYVTTDDLIKYQQVHYQSIASGKHSTSWGRQLSSQLWNLTRSILIHHNSVLLHETLPSHVLSRLGTLRLSISLGFNLLYLT